MSYDDEVPHFAAHSATPSLDSNSDPEYPPRSKDWYTWLIRTRLGYEVPKPWQTKLPMELDKGRDVFLITATGDGKSALIHVPILADITEGKTTLGLVIVPTKTLAEDQARSANAKDIPSLALHEDALRDAGTNKRNLFAEIEAGDFKLVFLGPEMLISQPFDDILKSARFRSLIRYIFVDEAHLACEWSAFREAYTRVRLLRARLGSGVTWAALTATCALGSKFNSLCDHLGFNKDECVLESLPVDRPNLKYVTRFLEHPISGNTFLDLCWIVSGPITCPEDIETTIILAERIDLVTQIKQYIWILLPPTLPDCKRIALAYHSIHTDEYRHSAIQALRDGSTTRILVSTDTGAYGPDVSAIKRVIIFGISSSYHAMHQRLGRMRMDGLGLTYFEDWMCTTAQRSAAGEARAMALRSKVPQVMVDYANPTETRCSREVNCRFWGQDYQPPPGVRCLCGVHKPDTSISQKIQEYIDNHPTPRSKPKVVMPRSRENHQKLKAEERARVLKLLVRWCAHAWQNVAHAPLEPPNSLVSTSQLKELVNHIHQCTSYDRLKIAMQTWPYFDELGPSLWDVCKSVWQSLEAPEDIEMNAVIE